MARQTLGYDRASDQPDTAPVAARRVEDDKVVFDLGDILTCLAAIALLLVIACGCASYRNCSNCSTTVNLLSSRLVTANGTNTVHQSTEGGASPQTTAQVPLK